MKKIIALIIVVILIVFITLFFILNHNTQAPVINSDIVQEPVQIIPSDNTDETVVDLSSNDSTEEISNQDSNQDNNQAENVSSNDLSDLDLSFLKMENKFENKVYSPLSIKYALKMLEEGAEGESKEQIKKVLGGSVPSKYPSSEHMSLANGLFIKDNFKDNIKSTYVDTLKSKYDAEVKYDSFTVATNVNKWIEDKTLGIIKNLLKDDDVKGWKFALVNALAIDMEWIEPFADINNPDHYATNYEHEEAEKRLEVFKYQLPVNSRFNGVDGNIDISTLEIKATINNYDIVSELGEENMRSEVLNDISTKLMNMDDDYYMKNELISISENFEEFWNPYFEEISANYHKLGSSTDFSLYVDDNVKVFAKDLKEYDGTTLEYVGIMPIDVDLKTYVQNVKAEDIAKYIENLKSVDNYSNFKEGVATVIEGTIPKFKYYDSLNLKDDLKNLGILDVFDKNNANLKGICDLSNNTDIPEEERNMYIVDAIHSADIEFTELGIKAAAVTLFGGGGGGGEPYDYFFNIPVEYIDLTFNNPYMYLIRDKEKGDVWFVGTVYEPSEMEDGQYDV